MNGLTLLVMLALAAGIVVAWRYGVQQGRREASAATRGVLKPAVTVQPPQEPAPVTQPLRDANDERIVEEEARLVRALEAENARLRGAFATASAEREQLLAFAEDRRRLLREVAAAREDTARYRDLVVDIENNAPPALLDGPLAPDDLKLIVGIGPVLERMLHKMGVTTYRQIARWSERDIDEFDAKLPEFPGRIRRDAWVTQARELHQSKFGETLPTRER
ncbi:MAG TPA: hypothetical protein VMN56_10470 [Casimicrobiaceae bacterium]|nr:hypothetical protein [Casimicrobiaceae bacterium]